MTSPARFRLALFDLLSEAQPLAAWGVEPKGERSYRLLQDSVQAELSRLLNTRRASKPYLDQLTVIDYGIPDWSALHAARGEDCKQMARDVQLAIRRFEPRLQQPLVTVEPVDTCRQTARVRISGRLAIDDSHWPVVFVAQTSSGRAFCLTSEGEEDDRVS